MKVWILKRIEWGGGRLAGIFTSREGAEAELRQRGYTLNADGDWVQPDIRIGIASVASDDAITLVEIALDEWVLDEDDDVPIYVPARSST